MKREPTIPTIPTYQPPYPPVGEAGAVKVVNDPAEVNTVCQWAETLASGWGPLAEGACATYPVGWVREACSLARESKASRWKYVDSILGRFKTQGHADSARNGAGPSANGPTRLPPPDPADVELAKKRNAKAMADAKARREAAQ